MPNYINNKHFFQAICKRFELQKLGQENSVEFMKNDNYLAECFMHLANNLGRKPNFSNYTYLDDMKMDGILDCFSKMDRFDPERSENPFSYFTTTITNAFKRRITKEHRNQNIVKKNAIHVMNESVNEGQVLSMGEKAYLDSIHQDVYEYEEKQKERNKKGREQNRKFREKQKEKEKKNA